MITCEGGGEGGGEGELRGTRRKNKIEHATFNTVNG